MLRQLLATIAVVLGVSVPAWADDPTQTSETGATVLPPPAEDNAASAQEEGAQAAAQAEAEATLETGAAAGSEPAAAPAQQEVAPAADEAAVEQSTREEAPAEEATTAAAAARAVPEAVIEVQAEGQVRADELMGLSVVSADGQEVGEVYDLIFDEKEKLAGIVVGIGGFLGIGEKLVGIDWSQAEVHADAETAKQRVFVGLTAADLDAAPEFMTKEAAAAGAASPAAEEPLPEGQSE
jgi:sporulation protein YlmC with PRC-barrel domain